MDSPMGTICGMAVTPVTNAIETQLRNLLRDETHHEDNDCHGHQHGGGGAVSTTEKEYLKETVAQSEGEHEGADGEKDPEWGEEGRDFDDDEKKAGPVLNNPDLALAGTFVSPDRDIGKTVARANDSHRYSRGIGEGVRKQGKEGSCNVGL